MDICESNKRAVCLVDDDPQLERTIDEICRRRDWALHNFETSSHVPSPTEACDPGCIVLDVDAISGEYADLAEDYNARGIMVPIIVTAREANVEHAVRALRSGALTFLQKPCSREEVEEALTEAMRQEEDQRPLRNIVRETKKQMKRLSDGERDVLELLLQGHSNRKIASELGIGLRTVEARRARLFQKFEVASLAKLIRKVLSVELAQIELKAV